MPNIILVILSIPTILMFIWSEHVERSSPPVMEDQYYG